MPGSWLLANSYIVLQGGKRIWLSDFYWQLEEKMNSPKPEISLRQSGLAGSSPIKVKKVNVNYYGKK